MHPLTSKEHTDMLYTATTNQLVHLVERWRFAFQLALPRCTLNFAVRKDDVQDWIAAALHVSLLQLFLASCFAQWRWFLSVHDGSFEEGRSAPSTSSVRSCFDNATQPSGSLRARSFFSWQNPASITAPLAFRIS